MLERDRRWWSRSIVAGGGRSIVAGGRRSYAIVVRGASISHQTLPITLPVPVYVDAMPCHPHLFVCVDLSINQFSPIISAIAGSTGTASIALALASAANSSRIHCGAKSFGVRALRPPVTSRWLRSP